MVARVAAKRHGPPLQNSIVPDAGDEAPRWQRSRVSTFRHRCGRWSPTISPEVNFKGYIGKRHIRRRRRRARWPCGGAAPPLPPQVRRRRERRWLAAWDGCEVSALRVGSRSVPHMSRPVRSSSAVSRRERVPDRRKTSSSRSDLPPLSDERSSRLHASAPRVSLRKAKASPINAVRQLDQVEV